MAERYFCHFVILEGYFGHFLVIHSLEVHVILILSNNSSYIYRKYSLFTLLKETIIVSRRKVSQL